MTLEDEDVISGKDKSKRKSSSGRKSNSNEINEMEATESEGINSYKKDELYSTVMKTRSTVK